VTVSTRQLIVDLVTRYRLPLSDEKALQAKMAEMFGIEHVAFQREVRLDDKDIVDFMVGEGCAVEVKIGGSRRAIFRQVERYCQHEKVREIVLATNVPMNLPFEINGKKTAIAHLGRGWL
jgi:hypothetical protein